MFCSIRVKILGLLAAGFVATAISVVILAHIQLKTIIDRSQSTIYEDKIETITREIEQTVRRLHMTGQAEAYEEAFKASIIKKMRNRYYVGDDLEVCPFIIDTSGTSVMHPVFSQGDKRLSRQAYVRKMLAVKDGSFDYVDDEEKKWCVIKWFEEWDWIIGYAIPHEIKYADVRALNNMLISVIAGISTVVLFVLFVVIAKLLRPIVILTAASKAMAEGDLDHEIEIRSRDEMGVLAGSFVKMRDSIKKQILELDGLLLAVHEGRLDTRGNAETFAGGWKKLVLGINDVIDAFVVPITMTSTYLDRLSKGDIPEPIIKEYKGDFNTIRNNLNLLIDATSDTERIAEEIAVGSLTAQVKERSDDDRMMRALNRMIQRLNGIMEETNAMIQAVGQGKLDIRGNAEAFEGGWRELILGVNRLIDGLSKAVSEKAALGREMELARKIQTALLPKKPVISGYEITASCEPSEEVGGDYYDVISDGGFDWIVIGDVSGHGVTAGLVMMMVQTSIHTVLIHNPEVPPSQLLRIINQTIYENILLMDESKHMTIIVLACRKDGKFCFSGLHEDMLIRRAETGIVESIGTDGMWIGLESDISGYLSDAFLTLEPGDCIVLYTDGITEAIGQDGGLFGDERLKEIVGSSGSRSVSEIHAAILNALKDYEKPDDVTLFVMKRVRE